MDAQERQAVYDRCKEVACSHLCTRLMYVWCASVQNFHSILPQGTR